MILFVKRYFEKSAQTGNFKNILIMNSIFKQTPALYIYIRNPLAPVDSAKSDFIPIPMF